jgi:hypothetical protein
MKKAFSLQSIEKYSHIRFNENQSSGSRVIVCGKKHGRMDRQTDMPKLIVAFHNVENSLKSLRFELNMKKHIKY